jgi:hypothetical protein
MKLIYATIVSVCRKPGKKLKASGFETIIDLFVILGRYGIVIESYLPVLQFL